MFTEKTGLARVTWQYGVEACLQGKKVKFYKTAALVNELVAAKKNGMFTSYTEKT